MGLDAHVALRCPRLLHNLTEDGVQLIQIYYAMLNSIARGKLLQNISCGTPFYEMMDVQNGMQTFFDLNDDNIVLKDK